LPIGSSFWALILYFSIVYNNILFLINRKCDQFYHYHCVRAEEYIVLQKSLRDSFCKYYILCPQHTSTLFCFVEKLVIVFIYIYLSLSSWFKSELAANL
jgi:hypothetical protein